MDDVGFAVIVDGVRSRSHPDRSGAQRAMEDAARIVNDEVRSTRPLTATVGDEMQGAYDTLGEALHATLLLRLALTPPIDCRVGIGAGAWSAATDDGAIVDGPAWWAAREAIVEAKRRESTRQPGLRGWYVVSEGVEPSIEVPPAPTINAYLSCRDEIVSFMSARQRRLTWGSVLGRTQAQLAEAEGISASAVSQNLRRSGATGLLAAAALLEPA